MRALWMSLGLLFAACNPTDPGVTDACRMASEAMGCPECADGDVTCSLDGITVTELSCGGCQAEQALIQALCDAGSEVTEAEIMADEVCEPAE